MYEVHLRGAKKAVLLAWVSADAYDWPAEKTYESGTDEEFILHYEVETKYDNSPYAGTGGWDGTKDDLSPYSIEKIDAEEYFLPISGSSESVSGRLGIEIEMLHIWDEDPDLPKEFLRCSYGKTLAEGRIKGDDFDEEAAWETFQEYEEYDEELHESPEAYRQLFEDSLQDYLDDGFTF